MLGALFLNVGLLAIFVVVYLSTESQLILAQGADSLFDLAAGVILAITASVSLQPHDDNHPFGHQRAEPIGALVTAILAGVLAMEVLHSAFSNLISGEVRVLGQVVAGVLGLKFLLKTSLLVGLLRRKGPQRSSALHAVLVDTRNDVLATLSSLGGWLMVREGLAWADAAMAIPVALYIGYSGFALAQENLRYLMGEAPDEKLHSKLVSVAAERPGVLEVKRIRAQYLGQRLHVEATILIGDQNSATQGHDIALDVRRAMEKLEEVEEVFVHVDTRGSNADWDNRT